MNLPDDIMTSALDALTDDGDTYELPDGRMLRLHIEHDPDSDINDYECYGRTEQFCHRYSEGKVERPADMDGSARKIEVDQGYWMWWQPDKDMKSAKAWGGEADQYERVFRDYLNHVTDLLRYGFRTVGVSLHEHVTDSLGNDHLVELTAEYIGGVDSTDDSYLRELVSDQINELPD